VRAEVGELLTREFLVCPLLGIAVDVLFDQVLKDKLDLLGLHKILPKCNQQLLLAVPFNIINVAPHKPEVDVFYVVAMHFVVQELGDVDAVGRAAA
jgi:hypothetical protein